MKLDFKQKFEPKGNRIIHGAGQQFPKEYRDYWKTVGKYKPLLYMTYIQIKWPDKKWFRIIKKEIKEFPNVFFQIGLSMSDTPSGEPEKHYEQDVAKGMYDDKIDNFCKGIKNLKVPVFIRPAYEFNGLSWYGYKPKSFIKAWKHLITKVKEHKVDNVAWIWHYAPEGIKNYMDYYPGNNYVDWWGISIFSVGDMKDKYTKKFLQDAKKHKKPVMIAESSARHVGTLKGKESWNKWFKPYFDLINKNPIIKAFCYINWDWSHYGPWKDWGDCRISRNDFVKNRYIREVSKKKYIHNMSVKKFLKLVYK